MTPDRIGPNVLPSIHVRFVMNEITPKLGTTKLFVGVPPIRFAAIVGCGWRHSIIDHAQNAANGSRTPPP